MSKNKKRMTMLKGDFRTIAVVEHLHLLSKYGFKISLGKTGFNLTKESTAWCIYEFEMTMPTLDSAIFFADGYRFRLDLQHKHDKKMNDEMDLDTKAFTKKETIN